MRTTALALALLLAACGGSTDETPTCTVVYEGCSGGNACVPQCLLTTEVDTGCEIGCNNPEPAPGDCVYHGSECVFR